MKNLYRLSILLLVAASLVFSGCDSNDTGDLDLNFKLKYSGETLVMFDHHDYPDGTEMFFTRFSFFMSNVKLDGAAPIDLSEIEFINPTAAHQELSSAENGYTMKFTDIPSGTYDGIDFDLGVPSDLNAMMPADFSTDHPLASSGEYWLGWESYVFIKVEGKIDFDGDGVFEEGLSLHIGSDAVFKNTNMTKSFSISNGESTEVSLEIDLLDIFSSNGTVYDLEGTPHIHSLSQINQADELANNLAIAIQE